MPSRRSSSGAPMRATRVATSASTWAMAGNQRVEGRGGFHWRTDDQVGVFAQRRGVDVGEQHQPCAACLGGLGHVLGLALVAAIVEQDQQVLAAESRAGRGAGAPSSSNRHCGRSRRRWGDQVAGEETAEASAVAVHAQAAVEQPVGEALDVIGAGQAEGLLQAPASLVEVARPGVVAAHPLAAFGEQGCAASAGGRRRRPAALPGSRRSRRSRAFHQAHDRRVADSGVWPGASSDRGRGAGSHRAGHAPP